MIQLFDSEQELLKILAGSSILQVRVKGELFCLIRDEGSYYLIESNCPHSNYPMSDGKLNGQGEVVCMWHSYRFDLKTGREKFNRCAALRTYLITKNEKGGLEVSF